MAPRARGLVKSLNQPEHRVLCDLLADARRKAGLTQAVLAKRLKRPQSFVAKYEGGERRLDLVEFIGIVRAINADPAKVFRAFLGQTG